MAKKYSISVEKKEKSEVVITGSISWDVFKDFEEKALGRLLAHLEIDGFRKGFVPKEIGKKHIGDELILSDMAELALSEYYPEILKEENIDAIGRPHIALTKLARGNELSFTITTAVLPEITLPDYKKISNEISTPETTLVTDEEVEKVIHNLRELRAYGHVHGEENHDHNHDEELPIVDDAFASSFGDFKSVAEFRAKIQENIQKEKQQEAQDKRRMAIMEALMEKTSVDLPAVLVQSEQEKMMAQLEADITRAGMKLEEYLKQINKTKEEVQKEFLPQAEKRALSQLILHKIALVENITVPEKELQEETEKLLQMYPGADRTRTEAYADMVLTNDKVFHFLEDQK